MFRGMFKNRVREPFFKGPWRESSFQKGDLKYVIRELEEMSHGLYTPSPGAVYPTLQMLEEMGYAEATERDGKKIYTITEKGLKFLEERKDSADEVRSHMKSKWGFKNIGKMAMMMKEYHALEHLLSRVLRSRDAEKMQRAREILSDAYKAIEAVMAE